MVRITRYIFSIILAVLLGILLVHGDALATEIKRGGTITVVVEKGPAGLDPHQCSSINSWAHYEQVYESLLRFNYKMEIEPSLATSWDQPNPLTYIFHLRKGVKFHNGREMTANDVKYSFDRVRNPKTSVAPIYHQSVKSIEVLDKYTVKFTMSVPDVDYLRLIAWSRFSGVVPREVVEKHGDLKAVTCGTGPFKIKKYVPGDYTVYERNPDYWAKGLPRVDELILKVIKDETSRLGALRKGIVDIGWMVDAQLADRARKEKNLRVMVTPFTKAARIFLNHDKFPFNNKKLRQAVSCAIDREAMIKSVLMGYGELSACLPPACVPYALPQEEVAKLPFYRRDLELAKRLMSEAGYPDGFEFTIVSSNFHPDYMPVVQMLKSYCRDVGIEVKIQQVEWGIHINKFHASDFQALMMGQSWKISPDGYIRPYFHSTSTRNYSRYKNPDVDRMLDESLVTLDVKKRMEIWRKLQHIMAEDVAIIWAYSCPSKFEVVQDYVKDYHFKDDTSRLYLDQVWLDK